MQKAHERLMDIIASILAYFVCMTGIITGLVLSFAVFFSDLSQPSVMPAQPTAITVRSNPRMIAAVPTVADSKQTNLRIKTPTNAQDNGHVSAAKTDTPPQAVVAIDARQKPLFSKSQMRRLAERRARHMAYREGSGFETRFLHYDD